MCGRKILRFLAVTEFLIHKNTCYVIVDCQECFQAEAQFSKLKHKAFYQVFKSIVVFMLLYECSQQSVGKCLIRNLFVLNSPATLARVHATEENLSWMLHD